MSANPFPQPTPTGLDVTRTRYTCEQLGACQFAAYCTGMQACARQCEMERLAARRAAEQIVADAERDLSRHLRAMQGRRAARTIKRFVTSLRAPLTDYALARIALAVALVGLAFAAFTAVSVGFAWGACQP